MEESGRAFPKGAHIQEVLDTSGAHLTAVDDLLTAAFEVPQVGAIRSSYFDDFPVWRPGAVPAASLFALFDAHGGMQGCAGLRLARLKDAAAGGEIQLGLVGAVATQPAARGTGVATGLMEYTLDKARQAGCVAVVLWDSSGSSLYQRMGFSEFGTQCIVRLSAFRQDEKRTGSWELRKGWADPIFRLLKERPKGLRLAEQDITWIRRHRNTHWYSLWEAGRLIAACAIGRGIDLQGVVHEWHGPSDALRCLFDEVLKDFPGALLVGPEMGDITLASHRISMGLILPLQSGVEPGDWWFWGLDSV